MKYIFQKFYKMLPGFSLAEILVAVVIGSMVIIAILAIYSGTEKSAQAVTARLDKARVGGEVLQRIAEDIDRLVTVSSGATIRIDSTKFDRGYPTAQLKITRTMLDKDNKLQNFEEIIWQSSYDYDSDSNGLTLYRSRSGISLEDRLLEQNKENWEKELFVPICAGITYFKVQAIKGTEPVDSWTETALPYGLLLTLSFAQPYKTVAGTLDVDPLDKISRTIALDRTRKIKFTLETKKFTIAGRQGETESAQEGEPNEALQPAEEANSTAGRNLPTRTGRTGGTTNRTGQTNERNTRTKK